jgi:ribosome-binding factor A
MRRVNEAIREVLANAVADELEDADLGLITITGVETTTDLNFATVYVSVLGAPDADRALAALERIRVPLQRRVARDVRMKNTPKLTFERDRTAEQAIRLNALLEDPPA